MLKIRLQRVGRRNDPSFRLVAVDSRQGPKSGRHLEILGSYNPHNDIKQVKADRVEHWLSKGAQVSGTAHNIFVDEGIIKGKKKNVLPKRTPIVSEEPQEEATETQAGKEVSEASEAETDASEAEAETPVEEEGGADTAPAEDESADEAPADDSEEEAKSE